MFLRAMALPFFSLRAKQYTYNILSGVNFLGILYWDIFFSISISLSFVGTSSSFFLECKYVQRHKYTPIYTLILWNQVSKGKAKALKYSLTESVNISNHLSKDSDCNSFAAATVSCFDYYKHFLLALHTTAGVVIFPSSSYYDDKNA